MSDFKSRLKEERIRLGLSQTEFAELGGVKKMAQFNYEKGDRSPDSIYLSLISNAGADVQYILTGIPTTRGQLKAEDKLRTSDGFINARDKFIEEDDGDTSRDNEIFTTKMTYQLSEDEWELIQMFRQLSLIDKMQVVQLVNNSTNKSNSNVSISVSGDGNRTAGGNFNEEK